MLNFRHLFAPALALLMLPATVAVAAEPAPVAAPAGAQWGDILERIDKLEKNQADSAIELQARDARIRELEAQVGKPAAATPEANDMWGAHVPGRGFRLANTDKGTVDFSAYTYLRYLNQHDLEPSYTTSFGNTLSIDPRNDLQIQKVLLFFKGWVYDPKLNYTFYTWTSNTSQGDGAQVAVAGYLGYTFSDAFTLKGGIFGLPATRSMEGMWPGFLKVDYRTIADEYFRGSYTTGIFADGNLRKGLQYRVMLGNNLSQLGVSAAQMDDTFDTFSSGIWWMPSTGEYGPGGSFGDYESHPQIATRFGAHYTHSTEDRQSQPGSEDPENTQIRLSDGTSLFATDAFGTGATVQDARYQMIALDAGMKYRGYSLEAQYFLRQVDRIHATGGPMPFDELDDQGFEVQLSTMVLPKKLQLYIAGSQIDGEYGDPYDIALGANWFPLKVNKKLRVHMEMLHLSDSPVGYSSVPFAVGGNGNVFVTDIELAF